MSVDFRFLISIVLLAGSAVFLDSYEKAEIIPVHRALAEIPLSLGPWEGVDEPVSDEIVRALGKGEFLSRTYHDGASSSVRIFMAYFPSQRTGDTIHSPLNCLPGSGWFPLEANREMLYAPGHRPFHANRYYVAKGSDRALVLYWYWSHGRGLASEYLAKFYLVADSIRLHRSDGAMVRIIAPVCNGESSEQAEQQLIGFSQQLLPLIDTYVPR